MTSNKNYSELITLGFAPENSAEQRLGLLENLTDVSLNNEDYSTLMGLGVEEKSIEVKAAIASFLMYKASPLAKASDSYFTYASQLALYETEPDLRIWGVRLIGDLISIRPEAERILAELLKYELEDRVLQAALLVSLDLPLLGEEVRRALTYSAARMPAHLHEPLFQLIDKLPLEEQATCIAQVLTPFAFTDTKIRALIVIARLSQLDDRLFDKICQILETEAIPAVWAGYFTLLFRFKNLNPEQQIRAFETLEMQKESTYLMTYFSSFFDSNPGILRHLHEAFAQADVSSVLCLLKLTEKTGSPEFALQALASHHKDVRAEGLKQLIQLIPSYPNQIIEVVIQRLAEEPQHRLRLQMIEGLHGQSITQAEHLKKLATHFLKETNDACRLGLAPLLLVHSSDTAALEQLQICWSAIIAEPMFDKSLKGGALEKLLETSSTVTEDLQASFSNLLDETYDFKTFRDMVERGKLLFQDIKPVFPALLRGFYRFAEYYPQQPLRDIVDFILNRHQELIALRPDIGRIASITGDSALLKLASTEEQKDLLYAQIQAAIREDNVSEVSSLLRAGYANRTLKKSVLMKLFSDGLHHPSLYLIVSPVLEILQEAKLYSIEMVEAALLFLKKFTYRNDTSPLVWNYVRLAMEQEPSYASLILRSLNESTYLDWIKSYSEQSSNYGGLGASYQDYQHWREDYTSEWAVLSLLTNNHVDILPVLRKQLKGIRYTGFPMHWNLGHLYLRQLNQTSNHTEEDFDTVTTLFIQAKAIGGDPYMINRIGMLFYYMWKDFVGRERPDWFMESSARVAGEVMNQHILSWYAHRQHRTTYWIAAMEGVDFDHMLANWHGPIEALDTFLSVACDVLRGNLSDEYNERAPGVNFPEVGLYNAITEIGRLIYTIRLPLQYDTQQKIKPVGKLLEQHKSTFSPYKWVKNIRDIIGYK